MQKLILSLFWPNQLPVLYNLTTFRGIELPSTYISRYRTPIYLHFEVSNLYLPTFRGIELPSTYISRYRTCIYLHFEVSNLHLPTFRGIELASTYISRYGTYKRIFREYYTIRKRNHLIFWQRNYGGGSQYHTVRLRNFSPKENHKSFAAPGNCFAANVCHKTAPRTRETEEIRG